MINSQLDLLSKCINALDCRCENPIRAHNVECPKVIGAETLTRMRDMFSQRLQLMAAASGHYQKTFSPPFELDPSVMGESIYAHGAEFALDWLLGNERSIF